MTTAWTTAVELIQLHGADARCIAESEALDSLVCGEAAESAGWEEVIAVVEALLDRPPAVAAPTAPRWLH
jgi:hypothetical protein